MRIAVKGYIGSGKSYVSKYISDEYRFDLINGDNVVKELYQYDKELIKRVNDLFNLTGETVDTKALGEIVFNDPEQLRKLEEIVHPVLTSVIELKAEQSENIVMDIQVIDKLNIDYDYVIIVEASKETMIRRIKNRDNRSEEQINKILDLQKTHHVLDKRTYVVKNNDDDNIEDQIKKIMKGFNDCQNW